MASPKRFVKPALIGIYWIGCLTGFIFQSKEVCLQYFEYKTSTWIILSSPDDVVVPFLSFCITYVTILNRTNHMKYGLSNQQPVVESVKGKSNNWTEQLFHESSLLTIEQVFHLTPSPEETIDSCARRDSDMFHVTSFQSNECIHMLNLSKYYMQEYMCYRYSFQNVTKQNTNDVSHSLHWVGVSYGINLRRIFNTSTLFIFVHPEDGYPFHSRNFGRLLKAVVNKENFFYINYRYNEIIRLPPPYETWCTVNLDEDLYNCRRTCLIDGLKDISRFPATEMTRDPINMKHINFKDYKNDTVMDRLNGVYNRCKSQCQRHACRTFYAMTTLTFFGFTGDKYYIRVLVPEASKIMIQSNPTMTFLDFFVYIFSCFGLWFGLSCASFNPQSMGKAKKLARQRRLPERSPTPSHQITLLVRILSRQHERINHLTQKVNFMERTM